MNWVVRKAYGLRRRIGDAWWERRFGADTRGLAPGPVEDGNWYVTSPYRSIFQVLRAMELREDDVLFDLGCGKGRVLLCATLSPVRRIVGVDLNRALVAVARRNLARQPGAAGRVEVLNQNVVDVDYDEATVLFLFDPFGAETLRAVLQRLRASVERRPRALRLAFVLACTPASMSVLSGAGWLECTQRFDIRTFGYDTYQVTLWKSQLPAR